MVDIDSEETKKRYGLDEAERDVAIMQPLQIEKNCCSCSDEEDEETYRHNPTQER